MRKRTKRNIIEKAAPALFSKNKNAVEITPNSVWLPVPADVYVKVEDLIKRNHCHSFIIAPAQRSKDYALMIVNDHQSLKATY
jgi:hypothetical protein